MGHGPSYITSVKKVVVLIVGRRKQVKGGKVVLILGRSLLRVRERRKEAVPAVKEAVPAVKEVV